MQGLRNGTVLFTSHFQLTAAFNQLLYIIAAYGFLIVLIQYYSNLVVRKHYINVIQALVVIVGKDTIRRSTRARPPRVMCTAHPQPPVSTDCWTGTLTLHVCSLASISF